MKSLFGLRLGKLFRECFFGTLSVGFICLGLFGTRAMAKEPSLTAIEIYDGPSGASYVQLSEVLINGKAEMRECSQCQAAAIDKGAYGKLQRFTLAPGGVLERGADGMLRYSFNHAAAVVVAPMNVKFEHGGYSASELADRAGLTGIAVESAEGPGGSAQPIKKGVKLVFVSAPDVELAEFLRAERASKIPVWQNYLSKFPGSAHSAEAKTGLALLFCEAGEAALNVYDKSAASASPSYSDLKNAKAQSDQAHALAPVSGLPALGKLDDGIRLRLSAIVEIGRGELNAYHAALTTHTSGYSHLDTARKYADIAGGIDSGFPAFQAIQGEILQDNNTFQSALRSAESARDAKQFDQAMTFVLPYRAFAGEEARVAAVIDAAYGYHLAKGKQAEGTPDWKAAIREYEKAGSVKDTAEARDALKHAREQLTILQDRAAADKALQSSKDYEQARDIIHAYEVLSDLPATQRVLVSDDIDRLKSAYVQSSSQMATELHKAHSPIHGPADVGSIERAYKYLQGAYDLSENETYHDRMDLLGNELSGYFLDQAKHYLAKPAGSGTELGSTYLQAALPYKASNLPAVRDAQFSASAAHSFRSKLSIGVQFRDQTSQRDSTGFAGQLENAIATGLESSGIPVKVVRAGENAPLIPDFQLTGDVIQHRKSENTVQEAVESKFLAGTRELQSEAWNKANRAYEKAQMELQAAQTALQGAEAAKNNKKAIGELNKSLHDAQKNVEDAHVALDATPKNETQDIIRSYTYTKKTVNLSGIIQLQFRVSDALGAMVGALVPITKEAQKQYILLENVKQEDSEGVKQTGPMPDTGEFLTTLESAALDSLIAEVRKRVEEMPKRLYTAAYQRESEADLDGAAEGYVRFLEISRDEDTLERKHAAQFLEEQFNIRPTPVSTP
jgi:hypothetical protein